MQYRLEPDYFVPFFGAFFSAFFAFFAIRTFSFYVRYSGWERVRRAILPRSLPYKGQS